MTRSSSSHLIAGLILRATQKEPQSGSDDGSQGQGSLLGEGEAWGAGAALRWSCPWLQRRLHLVLSLEAKPSSNRFFKNYLVVFSLRDRQSSDAPVHSPVPQQPALGQAYAESLEANPALPCGRQGPGCLSHPHCLPGPAQLELELGPSPV